MNRKRTPVGIMLIIILILASLLAACGAAQAPMAVDKGAVESEGGFSPPQPMEAPAVASDGVYQGVDSAQAAERIVIKDGNLEIVVADPAASMDRISTLAEELGGFVVSANLYQQRLESGIDVPRATITIRVLAENMNQGMERIRSESDRLPLSESVKSQDVTSEYTDLQSRLRNLEATEKQLQEIMDEASRTEDVLSVYNQLVSVREQIEVIKGQIKYYEESADLSAITATLIANEAVQPLTVGGWQPGGVAKQAIQALINAAKGIATAAIWIILLVLPVLLLIFVIFILPVILIIRYIRRRRRNRTQALASNEPPATVG